jgi:putative glycerol-1-phosphate prenyltransferase
MLGLRLIYLDAGSGAAQPVPPDMIRKVRENINIPLIVGGGIRTPEQARQACAAGADILVVGNVVENNPGRIREIAQAVHENKE